MSRSRVSVLMLCRYGRHGASSRLRMWDLVPGLAAHGIDVTALPFFDDDYVDAQNAGRRVAAMNIIRCYVRRLVSLVRARRFDVLWIEKEALPAIPRVVEAALLVGTPYVLDVSDTLFLLYEQHRRALVRALLGDKMIGLARGARLTIVGNTWLESWARDGGVARVEHIPTGVDLNHYHSRRAVGSGPLVIGWIGSSGTAGYLEPLRDVLGRLSTDGKAIVRFVGAQSFALPSVTIDARPWSEDTEADLVAGFDIGLVPLPDTEWCRGKSAYKLFQYMAAGVPVVGSPVGANREVIQHGVNGFLADNAEEWRRALATLSADPALRARMGANGRRLVEQRYSLEAIVPRVADALKSATENSRS